MRKKCMFVFSVISLVGFTLGLSGGNFGYGGPNFIDFLQIWIGFSLPLLIHLIYISIFREQ